MAKPISGLFTKAWVPLVPSWIIRVIVPAVALVVGLGVGVVVGAPSSGAGSGSCQEALEFADAEMTASTDFAAAMVAFLDASTAKDAPAMEAALGTLGPINERTKVAVDGYAKAAEGCH